MSDVQASDSVIRQESTPSRDYRSSEGKETSDTSTPIAPQTTVKHGDTPDEDRDPRSDQGRSF